MYELRFWRNSVNIIVDGRYSHVFSSFEDAWNFAEECLVEAYLRGADEIDINNDFYPILNDDEVDENDFYYEAEDPNNWYNRLEEVLK